MQRVFVLFLLLCLIPWGVYQLNIRVPGDAAYLMSGAVHLLNGQSMSEYFFDSNPPMCYMIYTPALLLQNIGIAPYNTITVYGFILILMNLCLCQLLLKRDKSLSSRTKNILTTGIALSITLPATLEFGQKDHLILIGIIPFLLMQYQLLNRVNIPILLGLAIALFSVPFILIKPHYGLLPTALILIRVIQSKNIKAFIQTDFIALAIGSIAYIIFIALYTPDYIENILPVIMDIYVNMRGDETLELYKTAISFITLCSFIGVIAWAQHNNNEEKKLNIIFITLAILSIIPFILQNKGFSIHLYPAFGLIIISLVMLIPAFLKNKTTPFTIALILIIASYTLLFTTIIAKRPPLTHADYLNSKITAIIREEARDKPFLIIDSTTNTNYIPAMYVPNTLGSRFSSFWFIGSIMNIENESYKISLLNQFALYITQDLERYKPEVIAIVQMPEGRSPFEIVYEKHNTIQDEMNKYSFLKIVTIDNKYESYRDAFAPKPDDLENLKLSFSIYKRNP